MTRNKPPEAVQADLLDGLRRADPKSVEALMRTHGGRLLAVAQSICSNPQDAQDVVQEAMVTAVRKIDSFEGRGTLYAWLKRIVVTTALMRLRSQKSRPDQAIDPFLPVFDERDCRIEPEHGPLQDPERLLQQRETHTKVHAAIDALPETYRSVLLLRDIYGYSTEETAELVQANPGLVKVRLHRARSALKKMLEPLMRGYEP